MSSSKGKTGLGSSPGGGPIDEKKRRRMESNRESAQRSRQKKQKRLDDLLNQVGRLNRENAEIENKVGKIAGMLETFESRNQVLKAAKCELQLKLENLEAFIDIAMGVRATEDPMIRPCHLPFLSVPVFAASGVRGFNF